MEERITTNIELTGLSKAFGTIFGTLTCNNKGQDIITKVPFLAMTEPQVQEIWNMCDGHWSEYVFTATVECKGFSEDGEPINPVIKDVTKKFKPSYV